MNFLQSLGNKAKNERLGAITREEHKARIKQVQKCVDELDEITSHYWGEDAINNGWEQGISLDKIFEKDLLMLIPFYIFSHENSFPEYNSNEQKLA